MGGAYLETGEAIVLTADRVSTGGTRYDAMLTSKRLILIDSSNARFEPRTVPLSSIRTVRSAKASTGEPAIILTLNAEGDAGGSQETILFLQDAPENRIPDRDLWLKTFIELSVSSHRKASPAVSPRPSPRSGMEPSVRRWVAPDIARPRPENFPQDPRPRPVEMQEMGESHDVRPEQPVPQPVSEPTEPVETLPVQAEPVPETIPELENLPQAGATPSPGATTAGPVDLSRSIAEAARSLIAAKAREELAHAHPPRPVLVRKTSTIPEIREEPVPSGDVVQEPEVSYEGVAPEARDVSVIAADEPDPGSGPDREPVEKPAAPPMTLPEEPVTAIRPDEREPAFPVQSPSRREMEVPSRGIGLDARNIPATTSDGPDPDKDAGSEYSEKRTAPLVPAPSEPVTAVLPEGPEMASPADVVPSPQKQKSPADGTTPAESPATDRRPIITAIIVLICLLLIAGTFVLLSGDPAMESGEPAVTTHPTPLATPAITVPPSITPAPAHTASIPGDGVWIRVTSEAFFSGQAGNPGYLQPVSGTGERFVRVLHDTRPVRVSVQKQDNSGAVLTAEIFRNGEVIASRSVTAPMGTVELLIDPVTGLAPGMPVASPSPAGTPAGSGQIEYL